MQKLVLVGAGHAHLYILKQLIEQPIEEIEVTLISPSEYQYYSGMFSGFTEGLYDIDDIRINVEQLCEKAHITWKKEALVSIDPKQKMFLTEQGSVDTYDVISFDIGSLTAHSDTKGVKEYTKRIKPNYYVEQSIKEMQTSDKPVIVGGGVAGTELALSLQAWRKKNHIQEPVTLISSSERLLEQESEKASKKIAQIVHERGLNLYLNAKATEVNSTKIVLENGMKIPYQDALWLTGPRAPELFKLSKLPVDGKGYLMVESTLQVKEYPSIFGAGDCVTLSHAPDTPKNGVFAIREAPILWENIKGFLTNGEGSHYTPQKRYLAIMSIGYKKGFMLYNPFYYDGKWAWILKHRIDKKFIEPYQQLTT